MPPELHRSDLTDGVVTLTLDRVDKKNALSIALRDAVTEQLLELARDPGLRCLVLTGRGDVFSAGFDLAEFERIAEPEVADRIWGSSDRFHRALLEFPVPTLAAVNGPALAGGCDLALLCDLRIAAEGACFAHPEASFATVAYGLLHDLVGGARARELALTGRRVEADEALAIGLVTRVVPPEALPAATSELAARIAARPRHALVADKRKILRRAGHAFAGTLDL